MITLALGMVIWGLAYRWVSLTKGDNGIAGIPRPTLLGIELIAAPVPFFYFCLVVRGAGLGADGPARDLALRPRAARHPRQRGAHAGPRLQRVAAQVHRLRALRRSSAGFSGTLWAYYNGFVSPNDVQLVTSVETLLMVALGGSGTLIGPALGAGIIVFLKNFVSVYTKRWLLILGGVYIGVILFAPCGIVGALRGRRGR